jgi:hypothetical protein
VPAVVPGVRVQLAEVGLNVPVELVAKLTVPYGVVAPVETVFMTVAVHRDGWFTNTVDGEHETLVVVEAGGVAVTLNEPLLLV